MNRVVLDKLKCANTQIHIEKIGSIELVGLDADVHLHDSVVYNTCSNTFFPYISYLFRYFDWPFELLSGGASEAHQFILDIGCKSCSTQHGVDPETNPKTLRYRICSTLYDCYLKMLFMVLKFKWLVFRETGWWTACVVLCARACVRACVRVYLHNVRYYQYQINRLLYIPLSLSRYLQWTNFMGQVSERKVQTAHNKQQQQQPATTWRKNN